MNSVLHRLRRLFLGFLLLLCFAWAYAEVGQQILRHRAESLLAGIAALPAGSSSLNDAQPFLEKWAQWRTNKAACSSDSCTVHIDLVQTLPYILIGTPGQGHSNWLPRLADHLGLRNSAARAGLIVEHGVVTSRWFGEQVTLPVSEWSVSTNYIPYLSVSSAETTHLHDMTAGQTLLHPNRLVQHKEAYIAVTYSPEEDKAEKSALMAFHFDCITRFRPCENGGEILPEAQRMLEERLLTNPQGPRIPNQAR